MLWWDYFNASPRLVTHGLDYFGWEPYDAEPCYHFLHKLSDVIQALVANGFAIETFEERPESMGGTVCGGQGQMKVRLPLSYTLTAYR